MLSLSDMGNFGICWYGDTYIFRITKLVICLLKKHSKTCFPRLCWRIRRFCDANAAFKSSQVNTLPKAKSNTLSKHDKDMHKCSSVYSERGVPLPVVTSLKLLIQQIHPHVRVERDSGMCVVRDLLSVAFRFMYTLAERDSAKIRGSDP
jgi:hypothetical protein